MSQQNNRIFVFGSNLAGRHGKGAAKRAKEHYGAEYGVAIGHIGNSYAIPTKDTELKPLETFQIHEFVKQFTEYAREHPEFKFNVTRIGCGLAGHKDSDIAPMFTFLPNVWFDKAWMVYSYQMEGGSPQFFEGEL